MARSKKRKQRLEEKREKVEEYREAEVISNLPEKLLKMQVNSGTKIKKILEFALKEYPKYGYILWSAKGEGIAKMITCVEIFKRQQEGLHQVSKLRLGERTKTPTSGGDDDDARRFVPELNVLLSNEPLDTTELGYQAPEDPGIFPSSNETNKKSVESQQKPEKAKKLPFTAAEEFAAMGLRTGQKRLRKEQQSDSPPVKKNMKSHNNDN